MLVEKGDNMKKQELIAKLYDYGIVCNDPAYRFLIDSTMPQGGELGVGFERGKWCVYLEGNFNNDTTQIFGKFDKREDAYDEFYKQMWKTVKSVAKPSVTMDILKTSRLKMINYFMQESNALESDAYNIWRNLRRNHDILTEAKYLIATGHFIKADEAVRIGGFSAQDIYEKTNLVNSKTDAFMYLSLLDHEKQMTANDKQTDLPALDKLKYYLKQSEKEDKQKLLKNLLRTLIDPAKANDSPFPYTDPEFKEADIKRLAEALTDNYDIGEEFILPKKYAQLYPVKVQGYTAWHLEKLFGFKKQHAYQTLLLLRMQPQKTLRSLNGKLNGAVRDILKKYDIHNQDKIEYFANKLTKQPEFAKEFCLSSNIYFPEVDYYRYAPIVFDPSKVKDLDLHFERYTAEGIRSYFDLTNLRAYSILINMFNEPEKTQEALNMKVYCKLYDYMINDCKLTNEEASLNADQFIKQYDIGREFYYVLTQNTFPDDDQEVKANDWRIDDMLHDTFSDQQLLDGYNWMMLFESDPLAGAKDWLRFNPFDNDKEV